MTNQIQKILTKELLIQSADNNLDLVENFLKEYPQFIEAVYDVRFISGIYTLYDFIINNCSDYREKLIAIPSGNTVGFKKYFGHFPWDDDLDVGFTIENEKDFAKDVCGFIEKCLSFKQLNVYAHVKKNISIYPQDWTTNSSLINIVKENNSLNSNKMSLSEFSNRLCDNKEYLYFINVSFNAVYWEQLYEQKFKLKKSCAMKWKNTTTTVSPWIDLFPLITDETNEQYWKSFQIHMPPLTKKSIKFNIFSHNSFNFPINLFSAIDLHYDLNEKKNNDQVYSHVLGIKFNLDYNKNTIFLHFIYKFVGLYNLQVQNNFNILNA